MPNLDTEITTREACQLLGITPEWLRQVGAQGFYQPAGRNKWRLGEVVRGYVKYLQDEGRRTTKTAADSRVRDARATDIEIRTAERLRHLVLTDDCVGLVDEVIGGIRSDADGFAARCTRDLAMREKIENELADLLNRAADRLAKHAAALREGRGRSAVGRPLNS